MFTATFFLSNFIYLFIYLFIFGCTESSLLHRLSLVSGSGDYSLVGALVSRCRCFSRCGALAPGCEGFSSCGSQALQHRLNSCGAELKLLCSMWGLPGSGIEPVLLH